MPNAPITFTSQSLPDAMPSAPLSLPPVADWSILGVSAFILFRSFVSDNSKDREQDRKVQTQLINELTAKNRERIIYLERQISQILTLLNVVIAKVSDETASEILRKNQKNG